MRPTTYKNSNTVYQNLLENLYFEETKPSIAALGNIENLNLKRVSLKEGVELPSHKADAHVFILWLRGKGKFFTPTEDYVMHPGSFLEMSKETRHSVKAETDCVFVILKYKTS
jgi:quercetin dioxygenase-like cupin family protein